jgi:hypothetical protein
MFDTVWYGYTRQISVGKRTPANRCYVASELDISQRNPLKRMLANHRDTGSYYEVCDSHPLKH